MVEVDELFRPQFLLQFLARHDVSGALDEQHEELQRLVLQLDARAGAPQLARPQVEHKPLELSELRRSYLRMIER